MDTFDAIYARRAVKHYAPDHTLTDDEIQRLMEAAIQAPTSFNIQHWRFVLVRDAALRQEIRAAAVDQAQVTDASAIVILTGDTMAWAKSPERYWRNAPKEVQDILVPWITPFHEGKEQLQRDEVMRSCGMAGQTIMLAAKAMGYDTCPMIGFDAEKVAELIQLPADHAIGFMIAIGKATQEAWPKPGQLPLSEVLIHDRF